MTKKKLGIVGGLGPAATAYFYGMITDLTDAQSDQQHLEIILYSKPQIPDRTAYILKKSDENPVPMIVGVANALVEQGAGNIAIPCVTAHHFYDEITRGVDVPVMNVLAESIQYLRTRGINRIGIMATDGLIGGGVFHSMLMENGIDTLFPRADDQVGIMQTIYEYKANCLRDLSFAIGAANRMKADGAEVILLACTELSLFKRDAKLDSSYIDMLEILARCAIEASGSKIRHDY